jgi:hypothetical protein
MNVRRRLACGIERIRLTLRASARASRSSRQWTRRVVGLGKTSLLHAPLKPGVLEAAVMEIQLDARETDDPAGRATDEPCGARPNRYGILTHWTGTAPVCTASASFFASASEPP